MLCYRHEFSCGISRELDDLVGLVRSWPGAPVTRRGASGFTRRSGAAASEPRTDGAGRWAASIRRSMGVRSRPTGPCGQGASLRLTDLW